MAADSAGFLTNTIQADVNATYTSRYNVVEESGEAVAQYLGEQTKVVPQLFQSLGVGLNVDISI